MKAFRSIINCICCLLLLQCEVDSNLPPQVDPGGSNTQVTYRITFQPNFTSMTHPTDFPENGYFSGLMLVAHNNTSDVFTIGQTASPGFKEFAEKGIVAILHDQLNVGNDANIPRILVESSGVNFTEDYSFDITLPSGRTMLSFVAKIEPSPDWFVGIDGYELAPGGIFVEDVNLKLVPIDAGTDAGSTYLSLDDPISEPINEITGPPFTESIGSPVKELGRLNISRVN